MVMRSTVGKLWILTLVLLWFPTSAFAQNSNDSKVISTLSHQKIGLDETATLSIVVKGLNDVLDVENPQIRPEGLQIVSAGRQTSISMINGVTEATTQFSFLITPLQKGRYVIEPVTITINGMSHSTSTHRLEVGDAMGYSRPNTTSPQVNPWGLPPGYVPRGLPQQPTYSSPDLILEADLTPETVYKHEPCYYTLRLLTAVGISGDPRYSPIDPTGLISVPMGQSNRQEVREGRGYAVTEAKTAFYPMSEGEFQFPRSELDVSTGYFGQNKRLSTEPKTLKVLPLPSDGRPKSFTGAVGEIFDIKVSLSHQDIKTGQTAELKIEAEGEGNLDLVPYPYLPNWEGVEKKQVEGTSKTEVVDGVVKSKRTYVFRLKFKAAASYSLNDIAFSYFRPSTARYEEIKAPEQSIRVEAGKKYVNPNQPTTSEALPQNRRPVEAPGGTAPDNTHLQLEYLVVASLLAILGLGLGIASPRSLLTSWKLPGLKRHGTPKSFEELELALIKLAPESCRFSRESHFQDKKWPAEAIGDYESLRAQVSRARFGAGSDSKVVLLDLVQAYQSLIKRVPK